MMTHKVLGVGKYEQGLEQVAPNGGVPLNDGEPSVAQPDEHRLDSMPDGVHTTSHRAEARRVGMIAAFLDSRFRSIATGATAFKDFARSISLEDYSGGRAIADRLAASKSVPETAPVQED